MVLVLELPIRDSNSSSSRWCLMCTVWLHAAASHGYACTMVVVVLLLLLLVENGVVAAMLGSKTCCCTCTLLHVCFHSSFSL